DAEVTENRLGEKMMRAARGYGQPNSRAIPAGHATLPLHLDYIGYLVERRRWLAGDHFSVADITAAAHLSSLDYLGDVPWEEHEAAKEWYARIKSRPSFRQILADHVPGAPPPAHYTDLDFSPRVGVRPGCSGGPDAVARRIRGQALASASARVRSRPPARYSPWRRLR